MSVMAMAAAATSSARAAGGGDVGDSGEGGGDHHELDPFSAAPADEIGLEQGLHEDWSDGRVTTKTKDIGLLLNEANVPLMHATRGAIQPALLSR